MRVQSRMEDMSFQEMTTKGDKLTDKYLLHAINKTSDQHKLQRLVLKSLKSTRRILKMAEECQNTGGRTMEMLDEQEKQLRNAEGDLDEIKENMIKAQRNLNELFKCCGLCLCPCDRVASIENDQRYEQVWGTEQTDEGLVSKVTAVHKKRRLFGLSAPPSGPYIKKITNDAREDEMEKNLEQVGSIIGNLKIMATDMGNELDKQNKIIDHMSLKAEINIHHIEAATKKAEKLIKE